MHKWFGWAGTVIALIEYALFAMGYLPEVWFFLIGIGASALLVYALIKDRTHYAAVLQSIFMILNLLGALRIIYA